MTGWETFYDGRTIEDLCQQLLGAVPGENDRQAAGKWVVNMTWFRDRVCQGVGEDATEERLMQYTRGYIMQMIGGMLFPDASDSRVHMRWIGYEPPRDREETRLRGWRRTLNRLGITDVVWIPYADPLLHPVIPP
ncbi:hypothetical protein PIB30_061606 [Stylosanthes scabra]|uniref:Aminotransferase-like plant mobile domain-containing protein n=1 Tax=Stylosanthes scabra TaxID=79078 RepID=A0ABU6XM78_9FABA|nr:hypothetical protein [Stylosanthes scabra]